MRSTKHPYVLRRCSALAARCLLPAAGFFLFGCDTSDPMQNMYDRPSPALADPMNYSPNMDRADVMGGSIGSYNDKAMKQDVDELLNP